MAPWHSPDRKSATGAGTGERCHRRRTDTPTIYVNATTLQRYWPQAWEPDGLTILVHPNEGVDDQHAKTVLDDLLSDVETGSISSWNRSDNADDYEQVIGFLQLGVTVTAILLLSVSAIGMINIGLAGIEQCSHELLIRRALGATRASIAIQVIGSSVLLGLIIAFAAVLISAVLVWAIPWMMPGRLAAGTARIPIYGGDDCGLCVHRHLAWSALLPRPSKPYGCNPRWRCDEPEAILDKPADSWMVGIPIIDCIR